LYLLPLLCFEEKFVAEQLSPTYEKMKEKFLAFFKAFPRESPGTRPDTGLWKTSVLLGRQQLLRLRGLTLTTVNSHFLSASIRANPR
jgi:hypothetical protein